MLCGDFVGVFALGEPALFKDSGPSNVVWAVHALSGGVDICRPASYFGGVECQCAKIGDGTSSVPPAWFEQCICRCLFLPVEKEHAICGGGDAGVRVSFVGPVSGKLSTLARGQKSLQRGLFCGG